MKIGGPKPPTPSPISPTKDPAAKVTSGERTFAKALDGPPSVEAQTAPGAARPVDDIVAALRAGEIDGEGAAHNMIEQIVSTRGKHLSPELQQRLRDTLKSTLSEDPTLIAKLHRLKEAAEADR